MSGEHKLTHDAGGGEELRSITGCRFRQRDGTFFPQNMRARYPTAEVVTPGDIGG